VEADSSTDCGIESWCARSGCFLCITISRAGSRHASVSGRRSSKMTEVTPVSEYSPPSNRFHLRLDDCVDWVDKADFFFALATHGEMMQVTGFEGSGGGGGNTGLNGEEFVASR
jgi:hypothetical protein